MENVQHEKIGQKCAVSLGTGALKTELSGTLESVRLGGNGFKIFDVLTDNGFYIYSTEQELNFNAA